MPKRPVNHKAVKEAADRAEGVHPGGRPTKYVAGYCGDVVAHMSEGASLTSFAAEIGVARDTLSEWANVHPEFSAAVKIGKAKCAAWWEKELRAIAQKGGGPGAATASIFGLKNMAPDEWREKIVQEHSGPNGAPIQTETKVDLSTFSADERAVLRLLAEKAATKRDGEKGEE